MISASPIRSFSENSPWTSSIPNLKVSPLSPFSFAFLWCLILPMVRFLSYLAIDRMSISVQNSYFESPEHFFAPSSIWGHSKKAPSTIRKRTLTRHWICCTLILGLPASRTVETCLNHLDWYFLLQQPEWAKTLLFLLGFPNILWTWSCFYLPFGFSSSFLFAVSSFCLVTFACFSKLCSSGAGIHPLSAQRCITNTLVHNVFSAWKASPTYCITKSYPLVKLF